MSFNNQYNCPMNKACLFILFSLHFLFSTAQTNPADSVVKKKYFTQRLNGAITVDGILDEEAWNAVEWGGNFTQYMPNEGKPPSQPTNFKYPVLQPPKH